MSITLAPNELALVNDLNKRLKAKSNVEVVRPRSLPVLILVLVQVEALRRNPGPRATKAAQRIERERPRETSHAAEGRSSAASDPCTGPLPRGPRNALRNRTGQGAPRGRYPERSPQPHRHPSMWVLPCTTRLTGGNLLRSSCPGAPLATPEPAKITPRAAQSKIATSASPRTAPRADPPRTQRQTTPAHGAVAVRTPQNGPAPPTPVAPPMPPVSSQSSSTCSGSRSRVTSMK